MRRASLVPSALPSTNIKPAGDGLLDGDFQAQAVGKVHPHPCMMGSGVDIAS